MAPMARNDLVFVLLICSSVPAAFAQTPTEMRDAMEMMVSSAATCSDYLGRPDVLSEWRSTGRRQLTENGMSEADAESFMDGVVAAARAETMNETQKQVACEMVNIRALPQ